jgi:hypothetical protein
MNKLTVAIAAITLGAALSACTEQRIYVPMSNHTLSVAEHQEQDVLWVQDNLGKLYRCSNSQSGPKCNVVQ